MRSNDTEGYLLSTTDTANRIKSFVDEAKSRLVTASPSERLAAPWRANSRKNSGLPPVRATPSTASRRGPGPVDQLRGRGPRQVGLPLEFVVVEMLNPVLRGWGAYFRQGNSSAKFGAIDHYVHERMARLASRKHALSGPNWLDRFTWDWLGQLGIYRLTGTVRYPTANA